MASVSIKAGKVMQNGANKNQMIVQKSIFRKGGSACGALVLLLRDSLWRVNKGRL